MELALVFEGGGGKGAYEVGAWKALRELNLENAFKSVLGTSVGALNALLFGQQKIDMAERIWREISPGKILSAHGGEKRSMASQEGLRILLDVNITGTLQKQVYVCCSRVTRKTISDDRFSLWGDSGKDGGLFSGGGFFGVHVDETITPEYIKLNGLSKEKQIQYLLASSAIPAVYESVSIDGKEYRDGGILKEHNLPFMKAFELGYRKVLAISLEEGVSGQRTIDGNQVYILRPSVSLGDLVSGTLDFDAQNAMWRMECGYRDFMEQKDEIIRFVGSTSNSLRMPGYIRDRFRRMV